VLWRARPPPAPSPGRRGCCGVQPDYLPSIPPEQRGHGFGRQAMLLAEKLAGEHGATTIGLNVFAENVAARSLYASLNYEETALQMRKPL